MPAATTLFYYCYNCFAEFFYGMALPFAIDGLEAAGNLFFGSATWAGLLFGLEEVAMFAAASYAYTSTLA